MGVVPGQKKVAAFTPYYTEEEAGQVRAAFLAAGLVERDASVSDLIVRSTMSEVKRSVSTTAGRRGRRYWRVSCGAAAARGRDAAPKRGQIAMAKQKGR